MKTIVLLFALFALVACTMAHTKSEIEYQRKFCAGLSVEGCAHPLCRSLPECQDGRRAAATVTRDAAATVTRDAEEKRQAFLRKRFSFSELTKPFTDVVDSAKNKIDDIKNSITEWTEEAKCYVGCLEKDSTATMMACGLKCKYLPPGAHGWF